MNIEPWMWAGVLAYSITVTLGTNWLVTGFERPTLPRRVTLQCAASVLASLLWILMVSVFSVLAIRYTKRMPSVVVGYMLFGMLGLLISWIRAFLFRRAQILGLAERRSDWQDLASVLVHNLTYVLFASVVYLAILSLLRQPIDAMRLIPLYIGAFLPDLDSRDSLPGRLVPWIARRLEKRLGHSEEWHTPAATALVALVTAPLIWPYGVQAWYLIALGFLTHLLLDMLAPRGVMLLWPWHRTRYGVFGGVVQSPGCTAERRIAASLAITALILLFVVDLRHLDPPPAPAPSYEQTLDRYFSMRGKTQVLGYIDGSWQISGRPISGWFEILNASNESFIVLDRYSGTIFTAGRSGEDNVYLNRIVLQGGPSILIKPVEIHLERQPLADALDIVYEMQQESGLQHIYVSGELLLPIQQSADEPQLQADHSQTELRRILVRGLGRYSLRYLSAADLIGLGDLQVETAELVIVATYARPATGPTVTPLPSPANSSAPGGGAGE